MDTDEEEFNGLADKVGYFILSSGEYAVKILVLTI
jgi:hypothetical protein